MAGQADCCPHLPRRSKSDCINPVFAGAICLKYNRSRSLPNAASRRWSDLEENALSYLATAQIAPLLVELRQSTNSHVDLVSRICLPAEARWRRPGI